MLNIEAQPLRFDIKNHKLALCEDGDGQKSSTMAFIVYYWYEIHIYPFHIAFHHQ